MGDVKDTFIWIKILAVLFFSARVANCQGCSFFTDARSTGIRYSCESNNTILYVDEELGPSKLVIINYDGDKAPELTDQQTNFVQNFGAKVEKQDDLWYITIEKSLDFESKELKNPAFRPAIKIDQTTQTLIVVLINLDDNPPELVINTAKCVVTEEQTADMKNCTYTVTDPDGCTNAGLTITVQDQSDTFSLELNDDSTDKYPDCLKVWPIPSPQSQFYLKVNKELDFETVPNYFLSVVVKDGSGNNGSNEIVVNVADISDTPPQWMTSLSTFTVPEKEEKSFLLQARDGDTSINADICYNLTVEDEGISEEERNYFSIVEDTGDVTIGAIDRDVYQHNTYNLEIYAFECDDPSWATSKSISIIVQDKNDNIPTICAREIVNNSPDVSCSSVIEISLEEEKPSILNNFYIIGIADPDEGNSGTFTVKLSDAEINTEDWSEAFNVFPNQGYQDGNFTVSVADPSKLDYENENWRKIQLKLVATEIADETHLSEIQIIINLINVNDESPEFQYPDGDETLKVTVPENLPADNNFYVVQATDADGEEDVLTYGLVKANGLSIDPTTGNVTTNKENVFDFELQQEVIIQVYARDSMVSDNNARIHTTFTTLTITVEDVNDVAPQIFLEVNAIDVDESEQPGHVLSDAKITASDVDTTSSLKYSIDWSKTTGQKNSVNVPLEKFENCYSIDGSYDDNHEEFIATLTVAKKLSWNDIDTVKLVIVVEDENTDEGYESIKSAVLTINIKDVNDHKPVFDSCERELVVAEMEVGNVKIKNGQMTATDEDGPDNNKIEYSIEPADNRIVIDEQSGSLFTSDVLIDRDCEGCEVLHYTVIALNVGGPDDGMATCDISISVTDINDNRPKVDYIETDSVAIYEDAESGVHITNISCHDDDVTPEFNTINFKIDTSSNRNLNDYFMIKNYGDGTAELIVQLNRVSFDYDEGDKLYEIPIIISDGELESDEVPTIKINILDINDNDPIFDDGGSATSDPKNCFFSVTEEKKENESLLDDETIIHATDIDSGKNGLVSYNLISVACVPNTNYECVSNDEALKLFDVKTTSDYRAKVSAKKDLITFFGDYILEINAVDHGDEPRTSKSNYYRGCIADVNDNAPTITYPDVDYLVIKEGNAGIILDDGSDIPLFHADDKDYESNAIVTFKFDKDDVSFKFEPTNQQNSFKFSLKDGITFDDLDTYYSLKIQACDSGTPQQCSSLRKLGIYKRNTNQVEPTWEKDSDRVQQYQFTEGEINDPMNYAVIPAATDQNNIDLPGDADDPDRPLEPIYYYLIGGSENFTQYFQIDSTTGNITLIQSLDWNIRANWELTIQASNADNQGNLPGDPSQKSLLTAKISVRDINDKSPKFTEEMYLTSISSSNEQFLTVEAPDPDSDDTVTYAIVPGSIIDQVENGQINTATAFEINQKTGALTFHYSIDSSISGFITLNVSAADKVGHRDECFVKVYIISDKFKVPFYFQNSREQVIEYQDDVAKVFSIYFEHDCIVGKIEASNSTEISTKMTNHFIDLNDSPIDSEEIKKYRNNATRMSELRNELIQNYNLVLTDVGDATKPEEVDDNSLIRTVLIAVCAVLGFLLLSMLALYIIKMRNLRKLVGNLTKATAPQEDKQNFVLPNTNQYIDVGSNPVFNAEINTQQLDNASVSSADSSFIGIEDNPEFEAFYNSVVLKNQDNQDDDILKENPQLKAFAGFDNNNKDDVNF